MLCFCRAGGETNFCDNLCGQRPEPGPNEEARHDESASQR